VAKERAAAESDAARVREAAEEARDRAQQAVEEANEALTQAHELATQAATMATKAAAEAGREAERLAAQSRKRVEEARRLAGTVSADIDLRNGSGDSDGLDDLTKAELVARAAKAGVANHRSMTKPELVNALRRTTTGSRKGG
jgi:hypothetical protein